LKGDGVKPLEKKFQSKMSRERKKMRNIDVVLKKKKGKNNLGDQILWEGRVNG